MSEINNLVYFLNSMKKTLPFKDDKDFQKKINENKDFRIKVQKLVYLSKFFGWNNNYHFNFHINGPFSATLSADYHSTDLINQECEAIAKIDLDKFNSFVKNHDNDTLESESTLLYYSNKMDTKNLSKTDSLNILKSLKPHIHQDIASKSYDNIEKFNLFNQNINDNQINDLDKFEKIVKDKAKGLMDIFETFDISSNRLFILGSLDYFRIVFDHENVKDIEKSELLNKLYNYCEKIEKEYFKNYSKLANFEYVNLEYLKHDFNSLEEYVSDELGILPKFNEHSDLSIFF
ncbi:hypothetical protein [uncultured Methanobrevibacter sp.]|uniref:hypothetical protein n=1 Tax=uncultured Methanobrevibacter sp. TaxID=253161 RepID=UPI002625D3FB|nr:hypothetical protein [uncultured Methanobrevibacter sp.]